MEILTKARGDHLLRDTNPLGTFNARIGTVATAVYVASNAAEKR